MPTPPLKASGVAGAVIASLLLAACSSPSSSAKPATAEGTYASAGTHPSEAEQAAAQDATTSFRTFLTNTGVTVANDLSDADQAAAAGQRDAALLDISAAVTTYEGVRGQEGLVSTGSDQAVQSDPGNQINAQSLLNLQEQLETGTGGASLAATLDQQGPTFEVLLAHRSLLPQDIALDAKRQLGWVALSAPRALSAAPPQGQSLAQVASAADAAKVALNDVRGIGMLVNPMVTRTALERVAALEAALAAPAPSAREIVGDANATISSTGVLAGSLAGYGVLVQGYQ